MRAVRHCCPIRSDLEDRDLVLVRALAGVAPRLMVAVGADRDVFNEATAKCRVMRDELTALHLEIQAHRSKHGAADTRGKPSKRCPMATCVEFQCSTV